MKVAIAGASGFIGSNIIKAIKTELPEWEVIALSRSKEKRSRNNVEWRQCDLYSLLSTEKALKGCDVAIYLVHSMLASNRLNQGNFEDLDLILADNFKRACKENGIKKIIYVSGIIPEGVKLSCHLRSRLEVENTLAENKNLTSIRAGLVLGANGSSFNIMYRLVKNLPFLIFPNWTKAKSNPIYIGDLIKVVITCLKKDYKGNRIYEVGSKDSLSYRKMMLILSQKIGEKKKILTIPFISPKIVKYLVSWITRSPKHLTHPLVESLKYPMIPNKKYEFDLEKIDFKNYEDSLNIILRSEIKKRNPHAFKIHKYDKKDVRSVQRINTNKDPYEIALSYFNWTNKVGKPFIKFKNAEKNFWALFIFGMKSPVFKMTFAQVRSKPDRAVFFVTGGILVKKNYMARLEFRKVNDEVVLVILHDYEPAIPWIIYKYTQALTHLFFMWRFQKYLDFRE